VQQRGRPLYGEQLRGKETLCMIQTISGGSVGSVRGLRCKLDGYPAFSYRPGALESLNFNDAVLFIDFCTCGRHSLSDICCCLPGRH